MPDPEPDPVAEPVLTSEALRDRVWRLFCSASGGREVDHAACSKYAELLFRHLPKARTVDALDVVERQRAALRAESERRDADSDAS